MRFAILGASLLLAACDGDETNCGSDAACHQMYALNRGETVLVTTTPDGTKLWARNGLYGRTIYFSTSGTSFQQQRGKTTETVIVPNSN